MPKIDYAFLGSIMASIVGLEVFSRMLFAPAERGWKSAGTKAVAGGIAAMTVRYALGAKGFKFITAATAKKVENAIWIGTAALVAFDFLDDVIDQARDSGLLPKKPWLSDIQEKALGETVYSQALDGYSDVPSYLQGYEDVPSHLQETIYTSLDGSGAYNPYDYPSSF